MSPNYTLLLNTLSLGTGDVKLAGTPFGTEDPYGIGLPKGSDGVAFVNAFLKKLEADGTWAKVWTVSIGDRTGNKNLPTPARHQVRSCRTVPHGAARQYFMR